MIELDKFTDTRVMGFDQDSQQIGWAELVGGRFVGANLFEPLGGRCDDWIVRLEFIRSFMVSLLKAHRPNVVVFEMPMGEHSNAHTNRVLGATLGVCLAAAWQVRQEVLVRLDIDVITVTPSEAQNTGIWGKTAIGMKAAEEIIKPRPGISEHEADALGIAMAGWQKWREAKILEMERNSE